MTKLDYMECHDDWRYDDAEPIRVTLDEEADEDENNEWM